MQKLDLKNIKIGTIWNEGRGASIHDNFEADLDFEPDIKVNSFLTGDLQIIKMKNGVTIVFKDLHTNCTLKCIRCLESFSYPVHIKSSECQFFEQMNNWDFDPMEHFLIRTRDLSIDLTESLRQELILQFPINPLCSEHCLGICPICHNNLNQLKTKHHCQITPLEEINVETIKPFSNLKNLLKNN